VMLQTHLTPAVVDYMSCHRSEVGAGFQWP
jgi:hypothetical protein